MKNLFKLDEKVATPGGFAYFQGRAGDLVQVRTRKSFDKGEVRDFPVGQVLPAVYGKLAYEAPVIVNGNSGRVVDFLYPRQLLSQSDYQLSRKCTKLPKPVSHCDGAYVGMWSYIVWFPHDPLNVHWYGAWEVSRGGECAYLPDSFAPFFELLVDHSTQDTGGKDPDEEPDNLNDFNIPGLSQGTPVQ